MLVLLIKVEERVTHLALLKGSKLQARELSEESGDTSNPFFRLREDLPGKSAGIDFGKKPEIRRQTQDRSLFSQDLQAESMEGGHRYLSAMLVREKSRQPFPHFRCSLVGEGEGENLLG